MSSAFVATFAASHAIFATQIVGVFVATLALTWVARRYALRRELLDHPGRRRSHASPTPRGGGIAIVSALLVASPWVFGLDFHAWPQLAACLGGLAAVAGIGWLDDHRPLPAWLRLLVHFSAASVAGFALLGYARTPMQWLEMAAIVAFVAGCVNAWNFMDGIDGLAASQTILAAAALLFGGYWLDGVWRGFAGLLVASTLGFLPFNFPRARIFLGDAGSGAMGYAVACLLLRAVVAGGLPATLALWIASAFLLDAGLTLLSRIGRGRRWWMAHREHLYQWLVRSGRSHVGVTLLYALWTLCAAASAIAVAARTGAGEWFGACALSFGCLSWLWLRKRIWMAVRHRPQRRR